MTQRFRAKHLDFFALLMITRLIQSAITGPKLFDITFLVAQCYMTTGHFKPTKLTPAFSQSSPYDLHFIYIHAYIC